jgi:hypothetical protein
MMTRARRAGLAAGVAALFTGLVAADTLILRSGKRVEGELIEVRGETVEFRAQGWSGRTERYDRRDVRSIEFESGRRGGWDHEDDTRAGGRPSGLRERAVSVDAFQAWTDTRIDVRRGHEIYFQSSGRVRWGKDRHDGPAGERNSPRNPGRPIPNRPGAALIGRIDGGDPFFIGDDEGPIRVRDSGRLELGINDDYLQDNSGSFRVTVYY